MKSIIRKKLISTLLIAALLAAASGIPMAAFAAETQEQNEPSFEEVEANDEGIRDENAEETLAPEEENNNAGEEVAEANTDTPDDESEDNDVLANEDAEENTEGNIDDEDDSEDNDEGEDENSFAVNTAEELKAAFEIINGRGTGEYLVRLKENIDNIGRISFCVPAQVTIIGDGHTLDFGRGDGNNEGGIRLSRGAVLKLGVEGENNALILTGSIKNSDGGLICINGVIEGDIPTPECCVNMYDGTIISDVSAKGSMGAAVTVTGENAAFNMYGGLISCCTLSAENENAFGGAVFLDSSTVSIYGGVISNCRAAVCNASDETKRAYGGAIAAVSGKIYIIPQDDNIFEISACSAEVGGGFYTSPDCEEVIISACIFEGNSASMLGGAVFAGGRNVLIDNTFAQRNSAALAGGAICLYQAEYAGLSNSILCMNTAENGYGGGLVLDSCGFVSAADNNVIAANSAAICAADVYISSATAEFAAAPALSVGTVYSSEGSGDSDSAWFEDNANERFAQQDISERTVVSVFSASEGEAIAMLAANNASSCTVSFDMCGHGDQKANETIESGTAMQEPDAPTEEGYVFRGWYTEAECINAFDFSQPVSSDITLYASWGAASYTVSFELFGVCDEIPAQSVRYGEKLTMPTAPIDPDNICSFDAWYTDRDFSSAFEPETEIKNDLVLYAKWNVSYTVEHYKEKADAADGSFELADTETKSAALGTTVNATAKAYSGFAADSNVPEAVSSGVLTKDTTLVLKLYYVVKDVTISFNLNGGDPADGVDYSEYTARAGTEITLPGAPTKAGAIFNGWQYGETYQPGDKIKVYDDADFTAAWQKSVLLQSSPSPSPTPIPTPTPRPVQTYQGSYYYGSIKTGDTSNIALWGMFAAVAILGFGAAAYVIIKNKKK